MRAINHYLATESATLALGKALANVMTDGIVLFLHGSLGAGKTTFARGLLRGLGYSGKVKSPTYTLVESYAVADHEIFHFDFYRLQDAHELEYIGIQDYFTTTSICLIEWPEKGFPLLPEPDLSCYLSESGPGREIKLLAHTTHGEVILTALEEIKK